MADKNEDPAVEQTHQSLPFLEVLCKTSGKIRRFSIGTEAGFAVNLINKKLMNDSDGVENVLLASHIEAVKEGEVEEEPVSFGHSSVLVDYGPDWKLRTALESKDHMGTRRLRKASAKATNDQCSVTKNESAISILYIGKILLAFLLIFVIGAIFTLALENLPRFILFINSSV
ncbi:Unknown protein [Striga hermonthica]|uniref:Uncharacterized protein n=1 Tax=Striga hermonthica TaxID=68872 RepID=A0A9N7NUZ2_STRHE|nr:Unknown protein [Striga hermonthica]